MATTFPTRLLDSAYAHCGGFRKGVPRAMGFGYQALSARNPRIITCSISGFGPAPARLPGFDLNIFAQGMSGLMSVVPEPPRTGRRGLVIAICDLLGGIFSAQEKLNKKKKKKKKRQGQRVQTSLLECIVSILSWSAGIYFDTGNTPGPAGNNHPLSSPHGGLQGLGLRVQHRGLGNEADVA